MLLFKDYTTVTIEIYNSFVKLKLIVETNSICIDFEINKLN